MSHHYKDKYKSMKSKYQAMQESARNQKLEAKDMDVQRAKALQQRKEDYAFGQQRAQEVLGRRYQGLEPEQRRSMEEASNQALNRQMQGYQRQLTAQQGQRGIRGGAAYAQNADLARIGAEAQQGFQRDLSNLEAEMAMKKLAAAFNIEQGEAAQGQLERQRAVDEIRRAQEEKRQNRLAKKAGKAFSRIKG